MTTDPEEFDVAELVEPDRYEPRPGLTHRDADWSGLRVLVAGALGLSGFAAAEVLAERGAQVIGVDDATSETATDKAAMLAILGVDVRVGGRHTKELPSDPIDLVVTSPGWPPSQPLLAAASDAGIPIWGEVELAWRMRPATGAAPWLTVTGTNGKTTTVNMLASILTAAGLRATSAGNVGTPLIQAVLHPQPYDVLAVELSSFQLHWSRSIRPVASCCLNVAADHIDWHGSFEAYLRDKGRVYAGTERACVYNVADPLTEQLVMDAEVQEGCRAIGFTLGIPAPSMLGLVDEYLADRAFVEQRHSSAAELATLSDLRHGLRADPGPDAPDEPEDAADVVVPPHYVANALAAAALARAFGVGPLSVRDGLRRFRPDPHRIAHVATIRAVRYVNDSKATNPHAAQAALGSFEHIVWIAGGLLKGADIDALVERVTGRLRAVVLIGADRDRIAQALARHAPEVPVIDLGGADTGMVADDAMDIVVRAAAGVAQPDDVVLLSPAAASMDMFTNYGARGTAFEEAVRRLAAEDAM